MFVVYESIAGLTSTITASSIAEPYVSQVRKYSDAVTISAASMEAAGTFDGLTRSNYMVEVTELGSVVVPGDPSYESYNFGRGFLMRYPYAMQAWISGGTQFDITDEVADNSQLTSLDGVIPDSDSYLVIAQEYPFDKFFVGISTANVDASTMGAYYWDGSTWTTVEDLVDGTQSGAVTMALDGLVEFTPPGAWFKELMNGIETALYWLKVTFTDGLTGSVDEVKLKNRPNFYNYDTEQTFTFECETVASGASQAIFSLTASEDGDLGQFECGVQHSVDGGSITFRIWENPDRPWMNIIRATANYQPETTMPVYTVYTQPDIVSAIANDMALTIAWYGSPAQSSKPLPWNTPDNGLIYHIKQNSALMAGGRMYRSATGLTEWTRETFIDMVNHGFYYDDHTPVDEYNDYIPYGDRMYNNREPVGTWDQALFHYCSLPTNTDPHIIKYALTDGSTTKLADDSTGKQGSNLGYCSAGQTLYIVGPNRVTLYNMSSDTFVDGDTTGLNVDGWTNPVVTYDYLNDHLYVYGEQNDENLMIYDPATDGLSDMYAVGDLGTIIGMSFWETTNQILIFRYGGEPVVTYNINDGTTGAWAVGVTLGTTIGFNEPVCAFKPEPIAKRIIAEWRAGTLAFATFKIIPGLEQASEYWANYIGVIGSQQYVHRGSAAVDCDPRTSDGHFAHLGWTSSYTLGGSSPFPGDHDWFETKTSLTAVAVYRATATGPWNELVSDGSSLIMHDIYDGATWAQDEALYAGATLYGSTRSFPFSGGVDQGDRIEFTSMYGVYMRWTDDYEAASIDWVTGVQADASAWVALNNGVYIKFSHAVASAFNEGDYWRFFGSYRYRPENIYNYNQRESWRSTDGSGEYVLIDLGSGNTRACDGVGILNSNLTPESTVRLQGGDGSSWDYPPLNETLTVGTDGTLLTRITNSTAYRYYRLYLDDSELSFFEVGAFFLGRAIDFSYEPAPPFGLTERDSILIGETPYGQRSARHQTDREMFQLSWNPIDPEDYTRLVDLRRVVKGGKQPFIFGLAGETHFVRWMSDFTRTRRVEADGSNALHSGVQVIFEEELP